MVSQTNARTYIVCVLIGRFLGCARNRSPHPGRVLTGELRTNDLAGRRRNWLRRSTDFSLCTKELIPQFLFYFRRDPPGLFHRSYFKTDGAYFGMSAPAVALADCGQIMIRCLGGPWIRTDRDLGAEALGAHRYRVGGVRKQIVRDEFVVAFQIHVDQVEEDYAVLARVVIANDVDGTYMTLVQRYI